MEVSGPGGGQVMVRWREAHLLPPAEDGEEGPVVEAGPARVVGPLRQQLGGSSIEDKIIRKC